MNKSERTRQYIIEKAAIIFNKKGYAATSLTDLTQATGLTKGSIYGNFRNKDEVALEAFTYHTEKFNKHLDESIRQNSSAIEKLLDYVRFYKQTFPETFANGGCPILNAAIEADDTNSLLNEKVAHAITHWEKNITKLICEGRGKGEIYQNIEAEKYAALFIALIEGGVMLSKTTGKKKYLLDALHHIEYLILHDLKKP